MKKQLLLLSFSFFAVLFLFFLGSCKKINEATELGANLIPAVDNVNTFDTSVIVETYNYSSATENDSVRSIASDEHFLGAITNDPVFGKTEARLFLQLKPAIFPYSFPFQKTGSTLLSFDSTVLIAGFAETYGDSNATQSVQVYEIAKSDSEFKYSTSYLIGRNYFPTSTNTLSSIISYTPRDLNDSITLKYKSEKVANQLRIPLAASFGDRLRSYTSGDAFATDSAFSTKFMGFELRPSGNSGSALLGIDLLSTVNTKLAFYYKYNNGSAVVDTVEYFTFTATSASANYISRDRSGTPSQTSLDDVTQDNLVYLQNSPGLYARIKIPALPGITNRVVHRAELQIQQVTDISDLTFTPPDYLFLDAFDATKSKYRTIPFDLTISTTGTYNAQAFGMIATQKSDGAGKTVNAWNFDVTRYVQHVVNKTWPNFDLRLSAPFLLKDILSSNVYNATTTETAQTLPAINPSSTTGRVRVGGGNNTNDAQRMKLRIIYSKL